METEMVMVVEEAGATNKKYSCYKRASLTGGSFNLEDISCL